MSVKYLTAREAADRLLVTDRTIRFWIQKGHFPGSLKKGVGRNSDWLIPEPAVVEFDEKRRGLTPDNN